MGTLCQALRKQSTMHAKFLEVQVRDGRVWGKRSPESLPGISGRQHLLLLSPSHSVAAVVWVLVCLVDLHLDTESPELALRGRTFGR